MELEESMEQHQNALVIAGHSRKLVTVTPDRARTPNAQLADVLHKAAVLRTRRAKNKVAKRSRRINRHK